MELLLKLIIPRAIIVLHDPHAEVRQSGCISALKILTAARAILDMIYSVWSTSYDITLLDSFCGVSLTQFCEIIDHLNRFNIVRLVHCRPRLRSVLTSRH